MLQTWSWESPYHKIIIPLLTNRAIPMRIRRDRFRLCGLLGLWNHSARQWVASPKALHTRRFESHNRWPFGKHLFGLEISRSSVSLPGPNPYLMESFTNIRQQYCYFTSNYQKCQWFPLSFLWIMEKLENVFWLFLRMVSPNHLLENLSVEEYYTNRNGSRALSVQIVGFSQPEHTVGILGSGLRISFPVFPSYMVHLGSLPPWQQSLT